MSYSYYETSNFPKLNIHGLILYMLGVSNTYNCSSCTEKTINWIIAKSLIRMTVALLKPLEIVLFPGLGKQ